MSFETEMEKALRHMCTYSSYLLLNLKKNQQVLQIFQSLPMVSLASNLNSIPCNSRCCVSNYV